MLEDTFRFWSFHTPAVFLVAVWVQLPCAVSCCHFHFAVCTLSIACVFALSFQYPYRILFRLFGFWCFGLFFFSVLA